MINRSPIPLFEMIRNIEQIETNIQTTGDLVENSKDEIDLYIDNEDLVGLDDEQNKTIVKQLSYEKINEDIH